MENSVISKQMPNPVSMKPVSDAASNRPPLTDPVVSPKVLKENGSNDNPGMPGAENHVKEFEAFLKSSVMEKNDKPELTAVKKNSGPELKGTGPAPDPIKTNGEEGLGKPGGNLPKTTADEYLEKISLLRKDPTPDSIQPGESRLCRRIQ